MKEQTNQLKWICEVMDDKEHKETHAFYTRSQMLNTKQHWTKQCTDHFYLVQGGGRAILAANSLWDGAEFETFAELDRSWSRQISDVY